MADVWRFRTRSLRPSHRAIPTIVRLCVIEISRYNRWMETQIHSAIGDRRIYALRLLFARFPVEEQDARLRDAVSASERGSLNLDHLLLAEIDGVPVGAALVMFQSDGVALVWPPVVSCGAVDEQAVEDLLMDEVCRRIDSAESRLGQCLLAPDHHVEKELLGRHGFEQAADMFFLACTLSDVKLPSKKTAVDRLKVSIETYSPETADRFAQIVEATYVDSLDCPYLTGFRTGSEAIASHKLSGVFDPSRWALYSIDGRDAGVILLNDHPDQEAVELVYLGVVPEARGRGLGRRMLHQGLTESARRGQNAMFLAVDCENHFANALYGESGFVELARRRVMLRHPGRLARQ